MKGGALSRNAPTVVLDNGEVFSVFFAKCVSVNDTDTATGTEG